MPTKVPESYVAGEAELEAIATAIEQGEIIVDKLGLAVKRANFLNRHVERQLVGIVPKENPDTELVQGKRELAEDLLDAAERFDVKGRELQRNVPHGKANSVNSCIRPLVA